MIACFCATSRHFQVTCLLHCLRNGYASGGETPVDTHHFQAPGHSPLGCSIRRDLFGPRWWWEVGKRRGGVGVGSGAPVKTIISAGHRLLAIHHCFITIERVDGRLITKRERERNRKKASRSAELLAHCVMAAGSAAQLTRTSVSVFFLICFRKESAGDATLTLTLPFRPLGA